MFWLSVFLTCFVFEFILWFLFVVRIHITVILVLSKKSSHDKCNDYWHNFLSPRCFFFHFLRYDFSFFCMKFWLFSFVKKLYHDYFKFASFLWFLVRIVITQNTVELCEYLRKTPKNCSPNQIIQHTKNDTYDICEIHIAHQRSWTDDLIVMHW